MVNSQEHKIAHCSDASKHFILEEVKLKKRFSFRLWYRVRVEAFETWLIYRDGLLYARLSPGPHILWNIFRHTWRVQRINLRTVLLSFTVKGRVKGPVLPAVLGAESADLGCTATATFQLLCRIADAGIFLQYEDPLSAFFASLNNILVEVIGRLPYDQYGQWATILRDLVKERIQGGRDDSDRLFGIRVEAVYVSDVKPDELQDRNMVAMYQQVERARRELVEAQSNAQRDTVVAESFTRQGEILNIAPSILALQNSAIGKELIARDAELRKLMILAGLNSNKINVQPLRDSPDQGGESQPSSAGYLNPPLPTTPLSPETINHMAFLSGPKSLQEMEMQGTVTSPIPSSALSDFAPPKPTSTPAEPLIDPQRKEQELAELEAAGFRCAGKGQNMPAFDSAGQTIPGSTEWVLEVYASRLSGYLAMIFHCVPGYPHTPPKVEVRPPSGGGKRLVTPNTIQEWNPDRLLVDVAKEINENTPG